MNSCLIWYLESKQQLSSSQFGFRHCRSTSNPLAYIETLILTAFTTRESILAIFFDLEKAYDTTWKYYILHKLSSHDHMVLKETWMILYNPSLVNTFFVSK